LLNPLPLTMALGPYDHTRDVSDGSVPVEGVSLRTLNLPLEEIFYRFTLHREWDISEMSTGKYIAVRAGEQPWITALPVFISRSFRHSMFYVRTGSTIRKVEDLVGKRVGVPEWAQSAGIYGRGYLSDTVGLDLRRIKWVQAGVNHAGRIEKVKLQLPQGLEYSSAPTRSLNDLLVAGEIDAVMSARPPRDLGRGIDRLMPDYVTQEEQYFRDTHIFPIMHALVVKTSVLEQHPWVAMNLFKAFSEAKQRSIERLSDVTASHAPLPWMGEYVMRMQALIGEDVFPYGIGSGEGGAINRATLDAFCKFGFEQGVCARRLSVEELFPATVLDSFKV